MVAVRSTGYSFDSIIGYNDETGRNVPLVNESYLHIMVRIANERFKINAERIARFQRALKESYQRRDLLKNGALKPDWEDAEARKRRKREEGLARKEALLAKATSEARIVPDETAMETIEDVFR